MRCWYCSATDSLLRRYSEEEARRLVLLPRTGFGLVLGQVRARVRIPMQVRVVVQVRVRVRLGVVGRCRWC